MELIETIILWNLPKKFSAAYKAKSMENTMSNYLTVIDDNKTRWVAEVEYTAFHGFLPKLTSVFMSGMFEKQTQKWLDQFKVFAEAQGDEAETSQVNENE